MIDHVPASTSPTEAPCFTCGTLTSDQWLTAVVPLERKGYCLGEVTHYCRRCRLTNELARYRKALADPEKQLAHQTLAEGIQWLEQQLTQTTM